MPTERIDPFCLDCGYDLIGSPTLRCSECGAHWRACDYDLGPFQAAVEYHHLRLLRAPALFVLAVLGLALLALGANGRNMASLGAVGSIAGIFFALWAIADATACARADRRKALFLRRMPPQTGSLPRGLGHVLTLMLLQGFVVIAGLSAVVLAIGVIADVLGRSQV